MSFIETLSACLPAIDARPIGQIEQEIVDELEFHIAMRTEENMTQGMSPEAARAAALDQFGNFAAVQRKCRLALLGARIMWQRIQLGLSFVLVAAVAVLALQLYSGQRANRAAIDDITSALKQLAPPAAGGGAQKENQPTDGGAEIAAAAEADPNASYPISTNANGVREFATLKIEFGKLKMSGQNITVVPISTKVGLTGAVLLGNGKYTYAADSGKIFRGEFHAAMLRFNPKDAEAIIKLNDGKSAGDRGAVALSKAVLTSSFSHCYFSNGDALIPPPRTIAADVYSRELGDVLFSGDDSMAVVYNFSSRKQLFEKN